MPGKWNGMEWCWGTMAVNNLNQGFIPQQLYNKTKIYSIGNSKKILFCKFPILFIILKNPSLPLNLHYNF